MATDRSEYMKKYYQENREHILEKTREYHRNHPEQRHEASKSHYHNNKEYYKKYREDRKEHYQEQKHQYYINNKETLNQKQSEVITCELCGGTYTRSNKARHQRTDKCTELRIKRREEASNNNNNE